MIEILIVVLLVYVASTAILTELIMHASTGKHVWNWNR